MGLRYAVMPRWPRRWTATVTRDPAEEPGAAIRDSVNDKHARYPELIKSSKARLAVAAVEVGGRWGGDAPWLIRSLAEFKARSYPKIIRRRTERAWQSRWWTLLSVAAQDTLAASLLNDGVFRIGDIVAEPLEIEEVIYDASREETLEVSRMPAS